MTSSPPFLAELGIKMKSYRLQFMCGWKSIKWGCVIQWGHVPGGLHSRPGKDSNAEVDLKPHCRILVRSDSPPPHLAPSILPMMAFLMHAYQWIYFTSMSLPFNLDPIVSY